MNFVKECVSFRNVLIVLIMSMGLVLFNGCQSNDLISAGPPADFHTAGPIQPQVDLDQLQTARISGTYRAVVGDILELRMASVLNIVTAELPATLEVSIPTLCRIRDDGTITVPVIGQIPAAGRTLAEIETSIVDAYYPEYIDKRPAVIVRVEEYKTIKTSIVGAVEDPGVYELASDEKSLVSLIMKAGGIVDDGAAFIHIKGNADTTLTLPVKGLNIPFADVALSDGASIEVEPLNPEVFTVVGLVSRPGAFPYPPNVRYNLMQALAFAGGVDEIADPRFVRVYRQKANGELIDATFALNGTSPVGAPNVLLKPGDVVAVEQTGRTHLNLMLAEILALRAGAGVNYNIYDGRDFRRTD